ncbi:hypothetical protein BBJ28_00013889 [Nothophytophthora sp. Chile5]|nr:hypothetical protein BBJ28_00013889 [Nothophytophthora sp. Chile5]
MEQQISSGGGHALQHLATAKQTANGNESESDARLPRTAGGSHSPHAADQAAPMLAVNSLMYGPDRRRRDADGTAERDATSPADLQRGEQDAGHADDEAQARPVPSARMRTRRRFVKPGLTSYELSFSRRHALAQRGRRGYPVRPDETDARLAKPRDEEDTQEARDQVQPHAAARTADAVSSLSSVLNEVMNGRSRALSNFVDAAAPSARTVTYVIEHAPDGTPYVAASDGHKYFKDSAIGQVFLKAAPGPVGPRGRRSDLDFLTSGGWQHQPSRRSDLSSGAANVQTGGTSVQHAGGCAENVNNDVDIDATMETPAIGTTRKKPLLGFKGFHAGRKSLKKKRGRRGPDARRSLAGQHDFTAVLDSGEALSDLPSVENEVPMLDPSRVDRSRGDSSWEVPAAPLPVAKPQPQEEPQRSAMELLDGDDAAVFAVRQSRVEALAANDGGSVAHHSPKTLPRLQPRKELASPPAADDGYDEDDNPLCQSFRNVTDIDFPVHRPTEDEEEEEHALAAAEATEELPDLNAMDFAGRVRVSSSATNVAEFVGGFKGQLSRRSGTNGFVNRKRDVRHARKSAAEQKAANFARKLREARNRVPVEFRDEFMSVAAQQELQKKKKWRGLGRRVRFDANVQCLEFEVESEDEDDGNESPDEIVDAVQLVSKAEVVHAEDVVAVHPMESLELSMDAPDVVFHAYEALSPPAPVTAAELNEDQRDDPLTFSQLTNDKRLSFSDL